MKLFLLPRFAAVLFAVFILQLRSSAQSAPAAVVEAEVSSVKFSAARFGSDTWFEADVEVEVKPGGKFVAGQFVNRVRVTLSIGVEGTDERGTKTIGYYRSTAEALSLEGGAKANFRFYFPPEIVKRDKLRTPVAYYAAEVEVAGKAQAPAKTSFSSSITRADMLQNFLAKSGSESVANDGLLIPQFLTPFAADSQRRTPTFARKEALR
jgi:hypothetical protein